MNKVLLIGRTTKEIDLKYSQNQNAVARFTLAIDTGYGDNKRTDFPNVVVFNKQAENCSKYVNKGDRIAVVGRLQTGSYEKDGHKVYTTDVIAENVEFLEKRSQIEGKVEPVQNGFKELNDDLPFDF